MKDSDVRMGDIGDWYKLACRSEHAALGGALAGEAARKCDSNTIYRQVIEDQRGQTAVVDRVLR